MPGSAINSGKVIATGPSLFSGQTNQNDGLTAEQPFAPAMQEQRVYKRGECVFFAGSTFHSLYAVLSGSIKVYAVSDDGEEIVFGFYLPGDLIGLEAITHRIHSFTAVALETSSIAQLPFTQLQRCCQRDTELQQRLNRYYSNEIARECALLLIRSKKIADERVARFLLDMSAHYAARGFSAEEFNLSMTRNEIGNYLGLASETVSRSFTRFQKNQWLLVDKRNVRLLDITSLRSLAGL